MAVAVLIAAFAKVKELQAHKAIKGVIVAVAGLIVRAAIPANANQIIVVIVAAIIAKRAKAKKCQAFQAMAH